MSLTFTREEVLAELAAEVARRRQACAMHVAAGLMDRATADRHGDLIERAVFFVAQGDWLNRLVEPNVQRSREQRERMKKKPRRRGS